MALVDREAILKELLPKLSSDDPVEARRIVTEHLRKRYGSFWIVFLIPIITELVKLLIERWKKRHS